MAPKTKFLSNDPLTRKKFARDLFKVMLPEVEFNYLTGTGTDAIVQVNTDLGKGEGDQVTFGIRLPLTGTGIIGDNTVEGNEEKLKFRNFSLTLEELNHAVDTGGRMEEQRVPYDLMQEGKMGLQEWWASHLSDLLINYLIGNSGYIFCGRDMASTGFGQVIAEPNTNQHMYMSGAAAESSLTSADTINLPFLDSMKQRAEIPNSGCYKIRPLIKGGKKYFRVIMHNYMFDTLRQNTNVGQWGDLRRNAGLLKMPEVEIEYNGMLISKSERIPRTDSTNSVGSYDGVYRCVLLGCQAGVWAWGGAGESKSTTMAFVPYTKDAERFVMIRGGGIFGMKAVTFTTSGDYGRIVGSAWADRIQA
jgi:N4-gp56 family major capsid protein